MNSTNVNPNKFAMHQPGNQRNQKRLGKIVFVVMGMLATLWFLVSVIPKPSRATYPCMRAAAPIMSSFVVYLLGASATLFAFKKARKTLLNARYFATAFFVLVAISAAFFHLPATKYRSMQTPRSCLDPIDQSGCLAGPIQGGSSGCGIRIRRTKNVPTSSETAGSFHRIRTWMS